MMLGVLFPTTVSGRLWEFPQMTQDKVGVRLEYVKDWQALFGTGSTWGGVSGGKACLIWCNRMKLYEHG